MMMLSNSLQWVNKVGAQLKAAQPSIADIGRRHWLAQRCAGAAEIADRSTEGNGPPHRTTLVKF